MGGNGMKRNVINTLGNDDDVNIQMIQNQQQSFKKKKKLKEHNLLAIVFVVIRTNFARNDRLRTAIR